MKRWSNLEIALSRLLHKILNVRPPSSQLAYAIYFTPDGFETRMRIIDHVLKQFLHENPACRDIDEGWSHIYKELGMARKLRNGVAHGCALILEIRGKQYVMHCPPGFDINRVGTKVRKGTIPGLTVGDIKEGYRAIFALVDYINALRLLIISFHQSGPESLKERYAALSNYLQKLPNRSPTGQNSEAPLDQPQPSSE
jgi:hypothetical protein